MIYLGKGGQITGPLTEKELETLRRSGGLEEYRWIWKMGSTHWEALDPPPPAPVPIASIPVAPVVHAPQAPQPSRPSPRSRSVVQAKHILAMGHNFRSAVSGFLENITEEGCELSSSENHASPPFSSNGQIHLNLLNPNNGHSMNVQALIYDIRREGQQWKYSMRWTEFPEAVLKSA